MCAVISAAWSISVPIRRCHWLKCVQGAHRLFTSDGTHGRQHTSSNDECVSSACTLRGRQEDKCVLIVISRPCTSVPSIPICQPSLHFSTTADPRSMFETKVTTCICLSVMWHMYEHYVSMCWFLLKFYRKAVSLEVRVLVLVHWTCETCCSALKLWDVLWCTEIVRRAVVHWNWDVL